MPIHFAAARSTAHSPIARALARKALNRAANDNGDQAWQNAFDATMRAALGHFAAHGLGAASEARRQAEFAHRHGDRQSYDWWLGICRTLDRKMAARVDRRMGIGAVIS